MGKIKIKEPENLLVYEKGYSAGFVKSTIEKQSLNGLRIFDHLDPLPDLDFLKDYTFLKHLVVTSIGDHDYLFLKQLPGLIRLGIDISEGAKKEIDLSHQTNLIELVIAWRKHIKGLEKCQHLEDLLLIEFKEKDLTAITALAALKHLSIKTSSIKDMRGIEGCKKLETLSLGNCRSLISLSALSHLHNLRKIRLNSVPKIGDYDMVSDLPMLTELKIVDCKDIPSISFIRNFPNLKEFILLGNVDVTDGDMTPVKNLDKVFYTNRKNYNISYPPPNLLQP